MSFIPINKMRALREAARQGDERAKKILRAQLNGSDYGADLDAYFAPTPAQEQDQHSMPAVNPGEMPKKVHIHNNPQLEEWLRSNGIKETDEDYEEALDEYYNEYPEQRPEEEPEQELAQEPGQEIASQAQEEVDLTKDIATSIFEAIKKCDETNIALMQNNELDSTARKGAMTTIQEIKQALMDSAEKLVKIKDSLSKKEDMSQEMGKMF